MYRLHIDKNFSIKLQNYDFLHIKLTQNSIYLTVTIFSGCILEFQGIHRGPYMSALVLLNLLELRKRDKM